MSRPYDPFEVPGLPRDQIAQIEQLNEMRAGCIRSLRKEFGPRFHGGFEHTEYAVRKYGDALAGRASDTRKNSYLRLLRDYPIGVATTGLHGSIGWKLAEYVATSRAIVTEPLRSLVPGPFDCPVNYLTFRTSAECVERVAGLLEDREARERMMDANRVYYHEWLRPDSLVKRTLEIAARLGA
jgi:hypothetical protein